MVVLLTTKSRSRNSKPGYVSRRERCPSHREKDMRHCLLKSPACAPKDNSCYQDGTSDGAYYEIGGTRTCDKGSWEESHVSQLLSLPQRRGRYAASGTKTLLCKVPKRVHCFLVLALLPCRMPPSLIGWISCLWIYPFFATDVKFIFLKTGNRAAPSAFRARVLSFPPLTPYHKSNRFVQIKNRAPLALAPADCQIREINDPMTVLLQPTRQPTQHILDFLLLLLLLYMGRQGKFSQKRSTNKDLALNFVLRYFFLVLQC